MGNGCGVIEGIRFEAFERHTRAGKRNRARIRWFYQEPCADISGNNRGHWRRRCQQSPKSESFHNLKSLRRRPMKMADAVRQLFCSIVFTLTKSA